MVAGPPAGTDYLRAFRPGGIWFWSGMPVW